MHWVWPIQVLLLAAVLVPALAWLGWHAARRRRQALAQWGGTATEAWTTAISLPRRFLREAALAAAWVLVLAALARPQYGTATSATELGGTVVLAIDASASMRAADVSPSRLALARQWALDLAAQLPGCRLGLIVFAGEAQVLCPPTEDHAIFRDLLGGLEGASAGREGSELGPTLGLGRELLGRVGGGVLVVVTDGEYHDPDPGAALEGRPRGALDLVTVTVGGSVPVPVLGPTPGGVVVDPRHGGTALTAARPGAMGELARAAGGLAIAASSPGTGSATAVRFIETRLAARAAPTTSVQRGERYQWPLGLALLLLILRLATREGTGRAPAAARNLGAALSLVLILCLRASGAGDAGVAARIAAWRDASLQAPGHDRARCLYNLALALQEDGHVVEARRTYVDALAQPGSAPGVRARCLNNLGALALGEAQDRAAREAGAALDALGRAQAALHEALRLEPRLGIAGRNLQEAVVLADRLRVRLAVAGPELAARAAGLAPPLDAGARQGPLPARLAAAAADASAARRDAARQGVPAQEGGSLERLCRDAGSADEFLQILRRGSPAPPRSAGLPW